MGVCLSCLGLSGRDESADSSDRQQLLGEPYPSIHYGTTGGNEHRHSPQVDPEEIRRQRDALERLCAATSDKLIDVTQTSHADERALTKMVTDYPRLFNEQFGRTLENDFDRRPGSESTLTDEDESAYVRHMVEEGGKDLCAWKTPENLGSLSIQFDDLLSAGTATGSKGKLQPQK